MSQQKKHLIRQKKTAIETVNKAAEEEAITRTKLKEMLKSAMDEATTATAATKATSAAEAAEAATVAAATTIAATITI